jgi:hypothetical protein
MSTPPFYSMEHVDRANMTVTIGEEVKLDQTDMEGFILACKSVSKGELDAFAHAISAAGQPVPSELDLRALIAKTHWLNPICSVCRQRERTKLFACTKCRLQFFCGPHCYQDMLSSTHAQTCGKPDAPFDAQNDPYRPVVLRKD